MSLIHCSKIQKLSGRKMPSVWLCADVHACGCVHGALM